MFIKPSKIKANRAAVINFMAATFFVFQSKMAICGAGICGSVTDICGSVTDKCGSVTEICGSVTEICARLGKKNEVVKPKYNLPLPDV